MELSKHPFMFRVGRTLLTIFWGSWILFGVMLRVIKSPKKFFYAKDYEELPECAKKTSYGHKGTLTVQSSMPMGEKLRISYMAAGTKGNPLLLLLHGFPECWYSWRFQLEEFGKDFYVVAVDTRGYGDSDKPKGLKNYVLSVLVEDVAAIIGELGYEKATLIGHDWGGAMTWGFASRYPDMCEKVIVLNCPHYKVQMKAFRSDVKQLLASWYMFYFLMPYLPEIVMRSSDYSMLAATFIGKKGGVKNRQNLTSEDLNVFKHALRTWEAREASVNYIRANLTYTSDFPRGKVTPKMLLIWGTSDLFLTKKMAEMSLSCATDITLKYIEGASHWVQQDCPEQVNKYIREFLQTGSD